MPIIDDGQVINTTSFCTGLFGFFLQPNQVLEPFFSIACISTQKVSKSLMSGDTETTKTPAPKKRASKPRAKARPYRRVPDDVLHVRINDMKKRVSVLKSKTVLIEDRLSQHEEEVHIREGSEMKDEAEAVGEN